MSKEEKVKKETLEIKAAVMMPRLPKVLVLANGRRMRLCDIDDEGLARLGDAWKAALLEKAREQRRKVYGG